jgi:hypothetical protein
LPLPSSINKKEIQVSRESSADRKSAGTIAVSVVFFGWERNVGDDGEGGVSW